MGDLGVDTAVHAAPGDDGPVRTTLNRDWEIWGPMGGYVAAVALPGGRRGLDVPPPGQLRLPLPRRRRRSTTGRRSTSRTVRAGPHGRGAAGVDDPRRAADPRGARCGRLRDGLEGLEHDARRRRPTSPARTSCRPSRSFAAMPEPPPGRRSRSGTTSTASRSSSSSRGRRPSRSTRCGGSGCGSARRRRSPTRGSTPCRALVLVDVQSWPARPPPPRLDAAAVHRAQPRPLRRLPPPFDDSPWLLADGHAPVAADGLIGWTGRMWSEDRRLLASAAASSCAAASSLKRDDSAEAA